VLGLVELVADGVAGGLQAGGDGCVAVLGNLCNTLGSIMGEVGGGIRTLVDLLGSLSAGALDGLGNVVCGVPGARVSDRGAEESWREVSKNNVLDGLHFDRWY
jgi:hypothetical protein